MFLRRRCPLMKRALAKKSMVVSKAGMADERIGGPAVVTVVVVAMVSIAAAASLGAKCSIEMVGLLLNISSVIIVGGVVNGICVVNSMEVMGVVRRVRRAGRDVVR